MKKRIATIAIALLLLTVTASGAFGLGIGLSYGISPLGGLPGQNLLLSVKADQLPFLLGVGARMNASTFSLGLTADWWAMNNNLVNFINYYLGLGLYAGIGQDIALGARLPIGLNAFPIEPLEIFLEVAPTLAFISPGGITFPDIGLQGAVGLRFWF